MKKTILSTLILAMASLTTLAQIVNIPDANFKAYLVGNSSINTNTDSEIQVSEAAAFAGTINCNGQNISDMTGIEAFTSLIELRCSDNNFTTLDLSSNIALEMLRCSQSPSLQTLNISQNLNLEYLDLNYSNGFTSPLDVSNNIALTDLQVQDILLFSLNISQNINLVNLNCMGNFLSTLDVSQNTALEGLFCVNNTLTSLDVSNNTSLIAFHCGNNNLNTLNMKNISTSTLTNFNAQNNPNLTCIEVDDVSDATTNWTNIDATASYSTNCSVILVTSISVQGQGGASTITTNGGTLQMEATVLPANASDTSYTWSVANGTGSATIDANGLLTALTNGTVTVTATANDGSGVTGDAVITISNQIVLVNSITVQGQGGASTITTNGGTLQMEATVLPANATDATYTWSVANGTGSATIDANGLLTALTNGTVTVTATANDGSGVSGTKDISISNQGTAIKDIAFKGLNIYPNPTNNLVNLEVNEKLTSLLLYDLTGKTVKTFNANNMQLNVSDIQQGVYFLELKNEDKRSIVKLIIN